MALTLFLVNTLLTASAISQTKARPLSEQVLVTLVETGIDDDVIVAKIRKDGLAFSLDEDTRERIKQAGASDAVLDALRQSGAGGPTKAVSYQDILQALQNGADETVLLQLLEKSPTVFTIGAREEAELQQAGATAKLLASMKGARAKSSSGGDITDFAIVLDCSGSMLEQTPEGQAKITAAKAVVTELVQKIPDGLRLTLVIYGHEKENPCQAVSILRPLTEIDAPGKSELARMIARLRPLGATPIALALRTAGAELFKNDAFCGLVLISDGKESCKGDPAGEAAELAKNPKLTFGVNVIGFDVKDAERRSLEAIATSGKGKYYDARSADELSEAVQNLRKELEQKAAPVQRESRTFEAAGQAVMPLACTLGRSASDHHDSPVFTRWGSLLAGT